VERRALAWLAAICLAEVFLDISIEEVARGGVGV
jgi:hypothetical protein